MLLTAAVQERFVNAHVTVEPNRIRPGEVAELTIVGLSLMPEIPSVSLIIPRR